MIVDPDFFDHWRTRMVVDALDGDEMAPVYILRLWAHCQTRKSDRFDMPAAGLKAQCRYTGDAAKFEGALSEAGFITRDGAAVHVVGWAEQNASLIAAWENGGKGGRPKRKPNQNPPETHGLPNDNQDGTQKKPIRGEEIGEEITPTTPDGVVVGNGVAGQGTLPVETEQPVSVVTRCKAPSCPHQEIIALYHELLPMGSQVRSWTGTRERHLQARWREDAKRQSLDWWRRLFGYVAKSEFLTGKAPPAPGRTVFVVSLGWLVEPEHFARVIEGYYHREAA